MINWFDMPAEGLSNGGLFEVKELEVTENGTYETKGEMYNKVTVNVEGGGSSWQTVFEGSVTTVEDEYGASGDTDEGIDLTADTIRVTFNGTEYTCEQLDDGSYGAPYQKGTGYDWSEYPFSIYDGGTKIATQTAGTYTLKIEEEQSGGGDFSTAEVTINKGANETPVECIMPWFSEEDSETYAELALHEPTDSWTVKVPVGGNSITVYFSRAPQSISGNIEAGSDVIILSQTLKDYTITGDCTINFS